MNGNTSARTVPAGGGCSLRPVSTTDSIIGTDVHGTITDWNRGASELYGYAAEEVVGRHVSLLTPDDRKAEISDFFTRVLAGESIPPTDTVRVHKDGRRIDVQLMLSPIADAVGKIVGVAGIARDTTVRKIQERAQQDFLAMASHDLRTPITVMRAQAQLMRRRKSYNDHGVEVILDQTHRMERLVADLQLAAQLETGQLDLQRTRIDAIALAEEAADRARAQTGRHQIRIEAPTGPVIAWWDRVRMGQVLDNLVGNAIKYSPNGGSIVIGITSRDQETRLSVADQGTGVAPAVQGQLFERFYRADDAGIASGLGLGLYITRMLVSAHGGRIEIDSIQGQGSIFTVILPVIDQAGPEPDR
jgi:PAS domain S-box-containing protein